MKKIIIIFVGFLFLLNACTGQQEIDPKIYLLEAKYDAMEGEIDSARVTHYKSIDGKKSNTVILTSVIHYDKNGYVTRNKSITYLDDGNIERETNTTILRDQNSLPTGFTTTQFGIEYAFELSKRSDKKETYQLRRIGGEEITKTNNSPANFIYTKEFGNLQTKTIFGVENNPNTYIETYNTDGKRLTYRNSSFNNTLIEEISTEYDESGQLVKKTNKNADTKGDEAQYRNYETKSKNWEMRERIDNEGNSIAFEVKEIFYRK